jgi:deazaflavin-dependent oxidoreductase (nitroreductase family)
MKRAYCEPVRARLRQEVQKWTARFATSKPGLKVDLFVMRVTGHSIVSRIFSMAAGSKYRRPLVLTTTGRRSGKSHSVVLPRAELSGMADALVLIGSKGGAKTDPHWVHNLRTNPQVRITYRRKARTGIARELAGAERAAVWEPTKARAPIYAAYETNAAPRQIPVVLVTLAV